LFAWALGERLALFPIPANRKRPQGIVRSHAEDWSKDRDQWRRWRDGTKGCNFGIPAGASGLIFVDVDVDSEGRPWLADYVNWDSSADRSACVHTPSGGLHFYYRADDAANLRQPDILRRRINVRAGRGYVLAPGCRTLNAVDDQASDGCYAAEAAFRLIPPATAKLLTHCAGVIDRPRVDHAPGKLDGDGLPADPVARLEAETRERAILERLRGAGRGERNNRLNEAAFALGGLVSRGLLELGRAEAALRAEGEALGLPREEVRDTVRSGLRAGPRAEEPRSALGALFATAAPIKAFPEKPSPAAPADGFTAVPEPIVERLLLEGAVTTLSGASGSGKTTLAASLVAASCADCWDFNLGFAPNMSNVGIRPAAWLFVSYEGGQHIARSTAAWHAGTGLRPVRSERCEMLWPRSGPLVASHKREVVIDERQVKELTARLEILRKLGLPIAVVIDNATAAVEDATDNVQVSVFMRAMKSLAEQGCSVLILAHPPKARTSTVYGSHIFLALADIVGDISLLRRDVDGGWLQWVSFEKHRDAPNGKCLELRSRRLSYPIIELPENWGHGNSQMRQRQIEDLHIPYIYSIRVRAGTDRENAVAGVERASEVSPKEVQNFSVKKDGEQK
jgi:hypothetical protein